jgi:hypothetical protein
MAEQEKLDLLTHCFKKLEESRKDYIRELTRKLVDIHDLGEKPNKREGVLPK